MFNKYIFFGILISQIQLKAQSLKINIKSLTQCDGHVYPVRVNNLEVEYRNSKLSVSGTLLTEINLTAPIEANIKVERDELGIWIPIPCIDNMGSCTYQDLCVHSIPENITCPTDFVKYNVPCRCPIPKGTYSIPPDHKQTLISFDIGHVKSVTSGKYYIKTNVKYGAVLLTCYEAYVYLQDSFYEELGNEIVPILNLV